MFSHDPGHWDCNDEQDWQVFRPLEVFILVGGIRIYTFKNKYLQIEIRRILILNYYLLLSL